MKKLIQIIICILLLGSCEQPKINNDHDAGIGAGNVSTVGTELIPMALGNTWIYEKDYWNNPSSRYDTVIITESLSWKNETVWVFTHSTGQRDRYFVRHDSVFCIRTEDIYTEDVWVEPLYVHCPDTLRWYGSTSTSECMDIFDAWENCIRISRISLVEMFYYSSGELLKEGIGIVKIYPSVGGPCASSPQPVQTLVAAKMGDQWYYW